MEVSNYSPRQKEPFLMDKLNLLNMLPEQKIYEYVNDPNDLYQEIQGKLYRSE